MGGADGWRPFGESAVAVVGRQLNLKQDFFFPAFWEAAAAHTWRTLLHNYILVSS